MSLTDAEREHIRLSEEYRAEVRAQLAKPDKGESLFDKLAVPVIILVATALVSGLLVPWILLKVEDERRAFDLQSRLIEQIVGDDAAAQASLIQFRSALATDPARRADVQEKLDADVAKYFIEQHGNTEWVRLHYGNVPPLAAYVDVSTREHARNVQKVRAGNEDLDFKQWDDAKRKLIVYISENKPRI